jgi:hypothetical protein
VQVVSFLLFAAMLWQIRKHGLGRQATTPAAFRSSMGQTLALTAGFLVSVPVAPARRPVGLRVLGRGPDRRWHRHRLRRGTDA